MQKKGSIILLNGTSSAGKTSLSKELQNIFEEEYCCLSLDEFSVQINQAYLRLFPFFENEQPETLKIGQDIINKPKLTLLHTSIKALSAIGKNVIVDHVLFTRGLLEECVRILEGYPVVFVGVHCPLHELERREAARGNRKIGLAKSQLDIVHHNVVYDVNVNTYEMDLHQCAKQIVSFVKSSEPTAFNQLLKSLS